MNNSPLHAAWLKKTFAGGSSPSSSSNAQDVSTTPTQSSMSGGGGVVWPDLLVSRSQSSPTPALHPMLNTSGSQEIYTSSPMIIERNNLKAVADLVIKQLLDLSLRLSRKIETEDYPPLLHLLAVLELILKHGFIQGRKYGIGSQKSVWDVLLQLESPAASTSTASTAGSISFKNLISSAAGGSNGSVIKPPSQTSNAQAVSDSDGSCASVECLSLRTSSGKVRAWLRCCLMQKNLADKFKALIDNKSLLNEFYYSEALLCSEVTGVNFSFLKSVNYNLRLN